MTEFGELCTTFTIVRLIVHVCITCIVSEI